MGDQGTGDLPPASSAVPAPREDERPAIYAHCVGEWYASGKSDRHRLEHDHFLTQGPAAEFMVERIKAVGRHLRVLDPAAGDGIPCCAAVEALASRNQRPSTIGLVVHEIDGALLAPLQAVLDHGAALRLPCAWRLRTSSWPTPGRCIRVTGPFPSERIQTISISMPVVCSAGAVYVSTFPDFMEFRKRMKTIAGETEVWLCDSPDHIIHHDGERFLGPRTGIC